jgi:hypothetical protein
MWPVTLHAIFQRSFQTSLPSRLDDYIYGDGGSDANNNDIIIIIIIISETGAVIAVSTVTGYGQDSQGSILGRGRIFLFATTSNRLWCPPNPLAIGYRQLSARG